MLGNEKREMIVHDMIYTVKRKKYASLLGSKKCYNYSNGNNTRTNQKFTSPNTFTGTDLRIKTFKQTEFCNK